MKDKKGVSSALIIGIVFGIVFLTAMIPVYREMVGQVDEAVLGCTSNATTPTLNTSLSLCTNASGVGVVNNTADFIGLSTTNSVLLLLIPLLFIMGVIVFVASKFGLLNF